LPQDGPKFGPGFQEWNSKIYRIEWSAIFLSIVGYLVWRSFTFGDVDGLQTIFWAIFPDLAAFIPIGIATREKVWPKWGSAVYNLFHNILLLGLTFVMLWVLFGDPYWPLFGWFAHITLDRAVGYGLRKKD